MSLNINQILDNSNISNKGNITQFKNSNLVLGNFLINGFQIQQNMMKTFGMATINYTEGLAKSMLETGANIQHNMLGLGKGCLEILKNFNDKNQKEFIKDITITKNNSFLLGKEIANLTSIPLIAYKAMIENNKIIFGLNNPITNNFLDNIPHNQNKFTNLVSLNNFSHNNEYENRGQVFTGVNNSNDIIKKNKLENSINNLSHNLNLFLGNEIFNSNKLNQQHLSNETIEKLNNNQKIVIDYVDNSMKFERTQKLQQQQKMENSNSFPKI